jgi:hypothetical protein
MSKKKIPTPGTDSGPAGVPLGVASEGRARTAEGESAFIDPDNKGAADLFPALLGLALVLLCKRCLTQILTAALKHLARKLAH